MSELLIGGIAKNVVNNSGAGNGEVLNGAISQGQEQNSQKKNPLFYLQQAEAIKNAIFGTSIAQNQAELNNIMTKANYPQPNFNSARLMQRQYAPSAFTNNQGSY